MVPALLFDISDLNLDEVRYDAAAVEQVNPHRGHMRMLDGVVWHSALMESPLKAVAFKDVRHDEFWVEGHIPGRPIFPGVLMVEAAAQLASFMHLKRLTKPAFMGFLGADAIKFRNQVVPGQRLYLLAQEIKWSPRRSLCSIQGLVEGNMVFEAQITGMVI